MLDNKDSFNNQPDNTKENREIRPWLYRRFEERARPLPKWRPAFPKSTLSTAFSPQLLRFSHRRNRLARLVINHTQLASRISRAERFISLTRPFGSLISRKTAVGFYDQNRMLDLPWFSPNISNVHEPAHKIDFRSQKQIPGDIAGRIDNKTLQLLPESARKKQITVDEKTPETYFKHLISPPITRKSAIDIVDNIVSPTSRKVSHARIYHPAEINYPHDSDQVGERKPSLGTRIRPTSSVSIGTSVDQAVTETSRLRGRQHDATTARPGYVNRFNKLQAGSDKQTISESDRQPLNTFSRQSTQSIHRISLPIIPAQKNKSIITTVSLENQVYSNNRQKTTGTKIVGTKTVPNSLQVRQARPDDANAPAPPQKAVVRTAFETAPHRASGTSMPDAKETKSTDLTSIQEFKEPGQESHTTAIPKVQKSGIYIKEDAKKDVSNTDSARDLLERKPLSIGRRIVQSLPFIKNISRKMNRPAETIPITAKKQSEMNDNRLSTNELELYHPRDEALGVKPDKDNPVVAAFPGASEMETEYDSSFPEANKAKPPNTSGIKSSASIPEAHKTKPIDFSAIKDLKESRHESYTAATPTMKKLDTTAKNATGKHASHAYPANDLFYRKSIPIGQRIVQSLPLIRNISQQRPLPSEVILSAGQKQLEMNDTQLASDNLEIPHVHGISDNIRKTKTDSLLIPGLVSDETPNAIGNEISVDQKSEAIPYSTSTVNNALDLVLTPVNRLLSAQQEENYSQSDQSIQYARRAQTAFSVQSTQQTQAGQSSQPDGTQASATKPPEENMNKNENQPDIRALAREIYPLIRRMIVVERERRPSR